MVSLEVIHVSHEIRQVWNMTWTAGKADIRYSVFCSIINPEDVPVGISASEFFGVE